MTTAVLPSEARPRLPGTTRGVVAARLRRPMPTDRWMSWLVTLLITGLGAWLRWPRLGDPHAFSFDETYYAKDAFSLITFGYEREFVDNANQQILASNGDPSTLMGVFKDSPSWVVHPPVGKWVIGIGEHFFGITPFGWRFSVAVLGTLVVLMTVRIGRRLTRSTLIGAGAGLLVALDGMAIVHSRTALLDPVLLFFVLLAFGAVLLDRDRTRKRLVAEVEGYVDDAAVLEGGRSREIGIRLGRRPWLWVAGVALGLACGTKWSGVWFVLGFGLLVLVWDTAARRIVGVPSAWAVTVLRTVPVLVLTFGVLAVVVYLATWTGWFLSDDAYLRQWAVDNPASGLFAWVPDSLRSLWHYHAVSLSFHTGLDSAHAYQSNAWGWPLQTRPTSYYFTSPTDGQSGCTVAKCASEVVALGNPFIWWAGAAALLHQTWRMFARRDWRSGAVVVAYAAGWVPWLFYQQRTIFTFYAVVMVPFLALALAMSLGTVLGPALAAGYRRTVGATAVGIVLLLIVLAAYWFYPIWTAQVIPYAEWSARMWWPTWV